MLPPMPAAGRSVQIILFLRVPAMATVVFFVVTATTATTVSRVICQQHVFSLHGAAMLGYDIVVPFVCECPPYHILVGRETEFLECGGKDEHFSRRVLGEVPGDLEMADLARRLDGGDILLAEAIYFHAPFLEAALVSMVWQFCRHVADGGVGKFAEEAQAFVQVCLLPERVSVVVTKFRRSMAGLIVEWDKRILVNHGHHQIVGSETWVVTLVLSMMWR